ncbi:MAG TPA: hypothetical protein PLF50_05915 [Candidatus Cloacimonadota bacterium]|nr:hypothetical protein [Candidatus Cloacimonadota bacterium]
MLLNERGFSIYTIISIILFIVLVFVLALPSFFNLDKTKNEDDCMNNMKLIWVAANEYMKDHLTSFNGDLRILQSEYKKSAAGGKSGLGQVRAHYLEKIYKCPENNGSDDDYIVFSKFFLEDVQGTQKLNYGTIVLCPNLAHYPKHMIPKSFYENMEPTELQNYFIDDIETLSNAAGSDGQRKMELITKYIEIWKTDPTALNRIRQNPNAITNQVLGISATPTPTEAQ